MPYYGGGGDGSGIPGPPGTPGAAATVTVGKVTTLAAGAAATVENKGTDTEARLDFGIPRGNPGSDATVPDATATVAGKVTLSSAIDSAATNKAATPAAVKKVYDESARSFHAATHKTGGDDALTPADIGALASTATAAAATKLATARSIQVDLSSTAATPFDGSAAISPGIKGVLPYINGGDRVLVAGSIGTTGNISTNSINIASATWSSAGVCDIVFNTALISSTSLLILTIFGSNTGVVNTIKGTNTLAGAQIITTSGGVLTNSAFNLVMLDRRPAA